MAIFFAWGEVKSKTFFSEDNYSEPNLIGDIDGSSYDAAHIIWGGAWRLPKSEEFEELIKNVFLNGILFTTKMDGL